MNTKKILGVVAVLALVAVAMVGAGAADAVSVPTGQFTVTCTGETAITAQDTLADAYNAIVSEASSKQSVDTYTITVTTGTETYTSVGFGGDTEAGKFKLVIDLGGNTVEFSNPGSGSVGTPSQCMHLTVETEISNGKMKVASGMNPEITQQNLGFFLRSYKGLSLHDVEIDASNLNGTNHSTSNWNCAVEADGGTITIGNNTTIKGSTSTKEGVTYSAIDAGYCSNSYGKIVINGTSVSITGDTHIEGSSNCTLTANDVSIFADGSIVIESAGELKVIDEGVTLNQVTDKIKKGTEQNAKITVGSSENTASTYVVSSDVNDSGVVETSVNTDKGITVKLNFASTYSFSVPSEVTLKGTAGGMIKGTVTASSTAIVSGKKLKVSISGAKKGNTSLSKTDVLGVAIADDETNNYVNYTLSSVGTSVPSVSDARVETALINLALSGTGVSAPVSDAATLTFTTGSVGTATTAGDYTGTLTFKLEIVDSS